MNRREFTRSLGAAFALPFAPLVTSTASAGAAPVSAISKTATFWAEYMTALHDQCTPRMMQNVLKVSSAEAQGVCQHLVSQRFISPLQVLERPPSGVAGSDNAIGKKLKQIVNKDADEVRPQEQQQGGKVAIRSNTPVSEDQQECSGIHARNLTDDGGE